MIEGCSHCANFIVFLSGDREFQDNESTDEIEKVRPLFPRNPKSTYRPGCCETVQDMFITPLYQQHASHTLALRVYGPQPHMLS